MQAITGKLLHNSSRKSSFAKFSGTVTPNNLKGTRKLTHDGSEATIILRGENSTNALSHMLLPSNGFESNSDSDESPDINKLDADLSEKLMMTNRSGTSTASDLFYEVMSKSAEKASIWKSKYKSLKAESAEARKLHERNLKQLLNSHQRLESECDELKGMISTGGSTNTSAILSGINVSTKRPLFGTDDPSAVYNMANTEQKGNNSFFVSQKESTLISLIIERMYN